VNDSTERASARVLPLELVGSSGVLRADVWDSGGVRGPLLMLHGGGQTRHSWDRAARRLATDGWQVFTLDARGHGESDWAPDGDYAIDGFVADFHAAVEQLQTYVRVPRPPVVIGASLGGCTGLIGAGARPGSIRALILVDIVPRIESDGAERIGRFMRTAPNGFASLSEAASAVAAYQSHRRRPVNIEGLLRNLRQRPDGRLYWHWDPAFLGDGRAIAAGEYLYKQMTDAATRIAVPVLLVRGSSSDIVGDDGVKEFVSLLPAAEVVDVAGAGHMVAGDDNTVFVEATRDFLARIPVG
jgi:pimeloyl-ACP methyl ester carboxylesterase